MTDRPMRSPSVRSIDTIMEELDANSMHWRQQAHELVEAAIRAEAAVKLLRQEVEISPLAAWEQPHPYVPTEKGGCEDCGCPEVAQWHH